MQQAQATKTPSLARDAIGWNIRPFVNGAYRSSRSSKLIENINPATESALCQFGAGDPADVDDAVSVASRRFSDGCWSDLPPNRRVEVLMRLADLIVARKGDLALRDALEMGKPIKEALYDAEVFAPYFLRSFASLADKLFGMSAPLQPSTVAFNIYEPRGVIGAIAPWNFPLVNAVIKVAPALAAGNTVVLKPSEISSASSLLLAELALEAGLPEGVLNVVPGLGSTVGHALAVHPSVSMLSFTGSTVTGRRIMELSGRSNGKPVLLECGGKSPQIVFDDIDCLEAVADATVASALWNQGQVCVARTRLLVQERIKDALLELVIDRARKYTPANPMDEGTTFGPLASPSQRDRVKAYIERGLADGAEPLLLGRIQEEGGCYVSPTILHCADPNTSVVQEEIFGPVLCAQSFRTEDEALELANGTAYGLAATVWTRDMGRGKRLARRIRAAVISVRTSGKEDPPSGCFLGNEPQKASGFGSELGVQGLQSYSALKSVAFTGD